MTKFELSPYNEPSDVDGVEMSYQMVGDMEVDVDHAFTWEYEGEAPENVSLKFATNGRQGGDAGHGGFAGISFSQGGGTLFCYLKSDPIHAIDLTENDLELVVESGGDIEQNGFVFALIKLGKELEREFLKKTDKKPYPENIK